MISHPQTPRRPRRVSCRPRPRHSKMSERVFAGVWAVRAWARSGRALGPLPELGPDDFVDVHADPTDAAFVDLDLVQARGGVGEPLRRAPVVLPEVGAQPVLQGPVDGL